MYVTDWCAYDITDPLPIILNG